MVHTPVFNAPFRVFRRNIAVVFGRKNVEWCGYAMVKKV